LIAKKRKKIDKIELSKPKVKAYQKSVEAIQKADLIVIGPGSLYTSIIPNLLISDLKEAIKKNKTALKVYIANCSTELGETIGYSVEDHLKVIFDHSGSGIIDYCVVNNNVLVQANDSVLGCVNNITTKLNDFMGVKYKKCSVINEKMPLYHQSDKLAKEIIELYNKIKQSK
jgi:uncharacterized cofD-like protein